MIYAKLYKCPKCTAQIGVTEARDFIKIYACDICGSNWQLAALIKYEEILNDAEKQDKQEPTSYGEIVLKKVEAKIEAKKALEAAQKTGAWKYLVYFLLAVCAALASWWFFKK